MPRLRTFGGLWIEENALDDSAHTSARRRPLALLALLVVAGEAGLSREKIVGYLWPDTDEERARNSLSQALTWLRRDLGRDEIVLGGAHLRINSQVLSSDVQDFQRSLEGGDRQAALALYTGPFLDGVFLRDAAEFDRWTDSERNRLHRMRLAALEQLAIAASAHGDRLVAVQYRRVVAAAEPLDSRAAWNLMEALVAAGDPAGAVQHFRSHEHLLMTEVGVSPDAALRELACALASGAPSGVMRPASEGKRSVVTPVTTTNDQFSAVPASTNRVNNKKLRAAGLIAFVTALALLLSSQLPKSSGSRAETLSWSADARSAFAEGAYYLARRTTQDRLRARAALERAVTLDPRFARAHAKLAAANVALAYFGYPGAPKASVSFAAARQALRRALALDSTVADAHLALAQLRWMEEADVIGAEEAVHRALAAAPEMADARFEHARILAIRGRADSATIEVIRARDLDPGSAVRHGDVAWVYWIVRRYTDAILAARATLAMDSTSATAYLSLGGAYVGLKQWDSAVVAFERGLALSRGNMLFLPQLGHAYARAGRISSAREVLSKVERLQREHTVPSYYVAMVLVGLGQLDAAMVHLEDGARERSGHLLFLSANDAWQPLRVDPRFAALIRRVGSE